MEMLPIISTSIFAAGWEAGVLRITYRQRDGSPGATWEYEGVSASWFEAFLSSGSKGKFLVHVKAHPDLYPARKVQA